MILYINGQDIKRLALGSLAVGADPGIDPVIFETDPDDYLAVIADYLKSIDRTLEDLDALAAVIGPGSPTAIRASLAIANTLAFARRLPTLPLEKPAEVDDHEFIKTIDLGTLEERAQTLKPIYLRPPNITFSNK